MQHACLPQYPGCDVQQQAEQSWHRTSSASGGAACSSAGGPGASMPASADAVPYCTSSGCPKAALSAAIRSGGGVCARSAFGRAQPGAKSRRLRCSQDKDDVEEPLRRFKLPRQLAEGAPEARQQAQRTRWIGVGCAGSATDWVHDHEGVMRESRMNVHWLREQPACLSLWRSLLPQRRRHLQPRRGLGSHC